MRIQENHLDKDRGAVKVAERKFLGQHYSADRHISFLKEHLLPRSKKRSTLFHKIKIFVHDNSPSYAGHKTNGCID